jgi:hypothetical protein
VRLRWSPNGATAGVLSEGAPVVILYERALVDDEEWVLVRDELGRIGWVPTRYLLPMVPLPTPTPTETLSFLDEQLCYALFQEWL